jgi:hypothetical protein
MQIKIEIVTESAKEAADVLAKVAGTPQVLRTYSAECEKQKKILHDHPARPGSGNE